MLPLCVSHRAPCTAFTVGVAASANVAMDGSCNNCHPWVAFVLAMTPEGFVIKHAC